MVCGEEEEICKPDQVLCLEGEGKGGIREEREGEGRVNERMRERE